MMKKFSTILIPLVLGAVIVVAYSLYWTYYLKGSVFTDDARVEGDIIPCSGKKMGRLVELPFSEGMIVKKGTVVARFDDVDALTELRKAKAEVAVVDATLGSVKVSLNKVRADVESEIKAKQAKVSMAKAGLDRTLSGARK